MASSVDGVGEAVDIGADRRVVGRSGRVLGASGEQRGGDQSAGGFCDEVERGSHADGRWVEEKTHSADERWDRDELRKRSEDERDQPTTKRVVGLGGGREGAGEAEGESRTTGGEEGRSKRGRRRPTHVGCEMR